MLKIKLTRLGKKAEPRYRIVVNEARDKRDGQVVATLGIYQPAQQPKVLTLDLAEYQNWLKKGAQPTPTVAFLADVATKGKGFPAKKQTKLSKKAKAKLAAAKEAEKTETVTEPAAAPDPEEKTEEKVAAKE